MPINFVVRPFEGIVGNLEQRFHENSIGCHTIFV